MESFSTAFRGLMMWMPSPSVSPVTRPKRVGIPTWPVGMEMTLEKKKISAKMAATRMRILEPTPRRLGREGILPPALKLMVVFGMTASVVRELFLDLAVLTSTTYDEGNSYRARGGWESVTKRLETGDGWLGSRLFFHRFLRMTQVVGVVFD